MAEARKLDLTFLTAEAARIIEARLEHLAADRFAERLGRHDTTLWGDDPQRQKVAGNRLGWLDSPAAMRAETGTLREFAAGVAAEGFTHAVLLGMGGSSLAPEVLRLTFPARPGALELTVLDNTSPEAVRAVAATHDPARTLFVVSSKSGNTLEVASFERHFFAWVRAARGAEAGRAFVAVTDPGTPLAALAARRGYRRVFQNPPDIGGRYSALSYFGLVPAALIGVDLDALLDRAVEEVQAGISPGAAKKNFGLELGATLGELARNGRDKVTFVLGPEIAAFGSWAEQLLAESTGKDGKGLVPIAEETLAGAEVYGRDRVFVAVSAAPLAEETVAQLTALEQGGHPVLRWRDPSLAHLGAEFVRWEIATATASAVLNVNPFDEPNVTEAKQATAAVLERHLAEGGFPDPEPLASGRHLRVEAPADVAQAMGGKPEGEDPAAWIGSLLALGRPGDYFAICAYLHRTPERHARLQRLRHTARAATRLATTLGYGPRFLHSTGQLHKGGPNTGVFLQLTADEGEDLPIPEEPYGFGALRWAQAAGDYEVLAKRGRRVMRIHLGSAIEGGLDRLIEAVGAVART